MIPDVSLGFIQPPQTLAFTAAVTGIEPTALFIAASSLSSTALLADIISKSVLSVQIAQNCKPPAAGMMVGGCIVFLYQLVCLQRQRSKGAVKMF